MTDLTRVIIRRMMTEILARQDKAIPFEEATTLREIGFRSLDFSELALRVEAASGKSLQFDGAALRGIQTVKDVLDFMEGAVGGES